MIHEYALEPELVASWHDRITFRYFVEMFGFGRGRVVSRYPKKWRRLVWEAFERAFGASASDIERKRIEELLSQLLTPEVRRPECLWNDGQEWLPNAEREHARRPFYAILARANPRSRAEVMCADDVIAGTPAAWSAPRSVVVNRNAAAMAECVASMLRCATRVMFVDPHFRASRAKYRNPLAGFLRAVTSPAVTVELHAGHATPDAPEWAYFKEECEHDLPPILVPGTQLVVRRWKNRATGDRLHNRYILTDVGGVQFGAGLDEGDADTTDDVMLLDADALSRRLRDFGGPDYAFELEGELVVRR